MKIKRNLLPRKSIHQFAEENDLTMVIKGYIDSDSTPYLCAYFDDVVVIEGKTPITLTGCGNTEEAAIRDYAHKISDKSIVVGLNSDHERSIQVPWLLGEQL